jgi:hypothetical protein
MPLTVPEVVKLLGNSQLTMVFVPKAFDAPRDAILWMFSSVLIVEAAPGL